MIKVSANKVTAQYRISKLEVAANWHELKLPNSFTTDILPKCENPASTAE